MIYKILNLEIGRLLKIVLRCSKYLNAYSISIHMWFVTNSLGTKNSPKYSKERRPKQALHSKSREWID